MSWSFTRDHRAAHPTHREMLPWWEWQAQSIIHVSFHMQLEGARRTLLDSECQQAEAGKGLSGAASSHRTMQPLCCCPSPVGVGRWLDTLLSVFSLSGALVPLTSCPLLGYTQLPSAGVPIETCFMHQLFNSKELKQFMSWISPRRESGFPGDGAIGNCVLPCCAKERAKFALGAHGAEKCW